MRSPETVSQCPQNTGQEFDGSDSGARPDEAVSWGKIRAGALSVKVKRLCSENDIADLSAGLCGRHACLPLTRRRDVWLKEVLTLKRLQ